MIINGVGPFTDTEQWAFLTVSVTGEDYQYTNVAPAGLIGSDLEAYLSARESEYTLDVLRDLYPGAVVVRSFGQTPLEAFYAWLGENPDVEKAPYPGKHPDDIYRISVLDFRKRFTQAEKVNIHSSGDTIIQVFLADLSAAEFVDFRDSDLADGISCLIAAGLLTSERATEIMTR